MKLLTADRVALWLASVPIGVAVMLLLSGGSLRLVVGLGLVALWLQAFAVEKHLNRHIKGDR